MSGKSKMTPGPWVVDTDPEGDEECQSVWYYSGGTGAELAGRICEPANARAIACLPELVDAARNVLELDRDTFPNYVRGTFAELRRILARIEGSDNG